MSHYQRVGDWLVTHGLITAEQRDQAIVAQKKSGGRFGEVIVNLGFCSEEQVVGCLAQQYDVPVADLKQTKPSQAALQLVSPTFALSRLVLPVAVSPTELHCVIADPLDLQVTDYLTQAINKRLVLSLAGTVELFEAIARSYALPSAKSSAYQPANEPAESDKPKKKRRVKVDEQKDRTELLAALSGSGCESLWEMYGE